MLVPERAVQVQTDELALVVQHQPHRIVKGIGGGNVAAHLRLQRMEAGVDFLHIGFLHGLHHQDSQLLRRGMFGCVSAGDGKGAAAVGHDEILSVLGLVVETVSGRLHLFPAHIRHMEGAPGSPHRLAGLSVIRGGRRLLPVQLRFILPVCLLRKGQHLVHMGLIRVFNGLPDRLGVHIQKFLIAGGVLELLDLRRQIVLLGLPQGGQFLVQGGDAPGHQVFVDFFLCRVFLRVLGGILRIVLPEKLVHIVGKVHGPFRNFFFGDVILEGHYSVFLRDATALTIVILMEAVPGIPHIAQVGELAAFLQGDVPPVGFIVDVIAQMLRHLHGVQFLDIIPAQIIVVMDVGVNIVTVQVFRQVDKLLDAARVIADLHSRLKPLIFILAHIIQFGSQVVQLVQVCILTQQVIEAVHIAVVVRDEPFLIGLPEVVLRTDPDTLKDLFQFLRRGGELHPFAHKGTLVIFAQVGDESGKGIIFVIVIMGHNDTSLQFRRRLFPMGLRLALIGTFLPALLQPLLDGGLFLRLPLPGTLMLPLVAGKGEIPFTGEAPLFLPHGVVAERNGINGVQQLRGQKDIQMLRQIAPAHILHLADVGLQNEILGIRGKLPELLQGGQSEGRLLDSGQEVTVLRGKSGKRLGRCLQFACVTACGEQRLQMLHEVDLGFTFCHAHHPFVWETPT